MSAIGFDIGNENCYIAVIKFGSIEILDNEYNIRSTPSYIGFNEKSRETGVSAKSKFYSNLENTVFGFKRLLGKNFNDSDLEAELVHLPYEICEMRPGCIGVNVNYLSQNVVFSIQQFMAMMLTKLKMTGEFHLNNKVRDCVISVPVFYTDTQRRAMLDSAKIAGLNVLKLMNESTAVALAYGFYNRQFLGEDPQNVIFVDLGHSSLTVTACCFTKDNMDILGCVWDHVGGRDFDKVLVEYFSDDFNDRYDLDIMTSRKALVSLFIECESVKKKMSVTALEQSFQLDCFAQDMDICGRINREIFERLSIPILDRIEKTLQKVLEDANLKLEDIYSVQIVGGSSRINSVKLLLQKVYRREPCMTLNQDEAVARGCALQCGLLSPSIRANDFVIGERPPYTIKISWKMKESEEYEEATVFSRYDKLPAFKMIIFPVIEPLNLEAKCCISTMPQRMHTIGLFTIKNIPEDIDRTFSKINVKVSLDIHCIFSIVNAKVIKCSDCDIDSPSTHENGECNVEIVAFADERSEANVEKEESNDKSNLITKSYDLTVCSEVPALSDKELKECIDFENQMIQTYLKEKESADARNFLEEYIYDVKGKLNCEFSEFIVEKDKTNLLEHLYEVENWLYEMDDLQACDYIKRLQEIENEFEPINRRYLEWQKRPVVIREFLQHLQEAQGFIDVLKCKEDIYKNEIENLSTIRQKYENYFNDAINTFSKLDKYSDFHLTVDDIRKTLKDFSVEFQKNTSGLLRNADTTENE